ncbi:MAG: cobalt chelatase, partial [Betaproteobacteria bacterium]|nr:cobalt chelatase [Betaproteobacteria bacterium]
KLLLVLSDGSPMDSATSLANDAQYLDHHLRDMVHAVEAGAHGAAITVFGVGVGLDLSPYYRRSLVLDLAGSTASDTLRELRGLLASRARR